MDHLYADSIAHELIDNNTNLLDDDIEAVTRELLGEEKQENDTTFIIDGEEYDFNSHEKYETNPIREDKIIEIENSLKKKFRRNKNLETDLGLIIRDVDIILDDYEGPLLIMGEITTNDKLTNNVIKLSAISYDANQKVLNSSSTLIEIDHGNYENFNINLDLDINNTEMIILLPEKIDDTPEEPETTNIEPKTNIPQIGNSIFIEQLPDIERKIGMTITNTSVLIKSETQIEIVGEIRIQNPDKYNNIKITATCYDDNNNIIGTENTKINTKLFLGFDTLCLIIDQIDINELQRIKLYPTLQ
jgi:hypothetical protein